MSVEQPAGHQHEFDRVLTGSLASVGEIRESVGKLVGPSEMIDALRRDIADDVADSSYLASGAAASASPIWACVTTRLIDLVGSQLIARLRAA